MLDTFAQGLFWSGAALLAYAYGIYPLIAWLRARVWPVPLDLSGARPKSVSALLCVRNEAAQIRRRIAELTELIAAAGLQGEMIVVSDGSTDATADVAEELSGPSVRVVRWEENRGKAAALTHAASLAQHEILVMADGRQTWAQDALPRLLDNFADPRVGAVSGDLSLEVRPGVLAGVGMYWRFEKWLRRQESLSGSQIGVTGAIAAVRRSLFRPIPRGTILDDVYWPMQVVQQGCRVIHEERAVAYDRLPPTARGELRRKLRTLVGNFQLAAAMPSLLLPWRNPAWLAFISHKMLRLAAPWAMLATVGSSALLSGAFYRVAFAAQAAALMAAICGLSTRLAARQRLLAAAGSFLLLHVAAWLAFWFWIAGGERFVWQRSQLVGGSTDGELEA
ncbi:MAG TPA: glycosyltransferase [Lacipirellulaceae bacterium]|nr:glycosyltransferase [Lacipirellulaceae bacterium]